MPDDQIHRFAQLGVIASMQPEHTTYTYADHTDEWSQRLGDRRAQRAWRCRDLPGCAAHPGNTAPTPSGRSRR